MRGPKPSTAQERLLELPLGFLATYLKVFLDMDFSQMLSGIPRHIDGHILW